MIGKKKINLFLTRTFVTSVAVGALTYVKPVVEDYTKTRNFDAEAALQLLYFGTFVSYNAWLRYTVDDEGESYTPKGLPGRDLNT